MEKVEHEGRLLVLLLALTFGTGVVDAVGYLGLDKVFIGNMTGNIVILGMGVTGAESLPVAGPLVALVGFMAGAAAAGRVTSGERGWSRRVTGLYAMVAALLTVISVALVVDGEPPRSRALVLVALLAVAMGVQGAATRVVAFRELTTVAVTSNLLGLSVHAWRGTDPRELVLARAGAILALVAGAASGAALLRWQPGAALGLSALVAAVVSVVAWVADRRAASSPASSPGPDSRPSPGPRPRPRDS